MTGTGALLVLLLVVVALLVLAVAVLLVLLRRVQVRATRLEQEAAGHAASGRLELEREAQALWADLREQRDLAQHDLERREQRLTEREARLDVEARTLEQRAAELAARRAELAEVREQRRRLLEDLAGLTAEQARAELVAGVEQQAKREAAVLVRDLERTARREGETRAREIVAGAIQRVASEQTAQTVVTAVPLPGEDYKGRIIGREGRNVRAFEALTGVTLIIDDVPDAVLLSCFDPVRRETARLTLEALVLDGRISPHRIEEQHLRSQAQVAQLCRRAGEAALVEVGIADLHPELVDTLGRLNYRTSFGQNVLRHLVESAQLAGLMAAELGVDVARAKRCALLHDLGKALTHEAEGSHAAVGAALARRCGEDEDVVHAIAAHHGEVEPRTVEAVLTQAADAISGSRPGARRESMEAYVTRLQRLEAIARAHEGVATVYAMQAGREVRVMVLPDVVDDIAAQVLARDIAKQVEEELTYPGQVRVTVVRESRAIEYAR